MMVLAIHFNSFGIVLFLFVSITYNACYTYDVPTESKLPVPVDFLDFFIHLLVIVSIAAV